MHITIATMYAAVAYKHLTKAVKASIDKKKGSSETKDSSPSTTIFKTSVKYLLLSGLTVIIWAMFVGSFAFLKHRQLCSYQTYVENGELISNYSADLCPNLLAANDWGVILFNAFNPEVLAQLEPSPQDIFALSEELPKCTDPLNPLCWITGTKPKLKQTKGYTNLLVVGLDSRASGKNGSYLKNTDTIMLVSLHHNSGKVLFTSFPRDLYVNYYRTKTYRVKNKINAIYATDGVEGLNNAISEITGKPVHYHAYVNIEMFSKVVKRLGGVEVVLKEPFQDRYPCLDVPANKVCRNPVYEIDGYYGLYEFPAGKQTLDSFEALVYARSRHLSSDYDRARRQQNIVKGMMEKAMDSNKSITERFSLYSDLYSIFRSDVITNIKLKDVAGIFSILQKVNTNAAHIVVSPSLGGYNRLISYAGILPGAGWSITFNDHSYQQFQSYMNRIWTYLPYYIEKPKILVVNATGSTIPKNSPLGKFIKSKNTFYKVTVVNKPNLNLAGVRIYDFSDGKKVGSVREIRQKIPNSLIYNAEIDNVTQSKKKENILIVWGKKSSFG